MSEVFTKEQREWIRNEFQRMLTTDFRRRYVTMDACMEGSSLVKGICDQCKVRLPKKMLAAAGLYPGADCKITFQGGKIIIERTG